MATKGSKTTKRQHDAISGKKVQINYKNFKTLLREKDVLIITTISHKDILQFLNNKKIGKWVMGMRLKRESKE
jgi:hypothetical protein